MNPPTETEIDRLSRRREEGARRLNADLEAQAEAEATDYTFAFWYTILATPAVLIAGTIFFVWYFGRH